MVTETNKLNPPEPLTSRTGAEGNRDCRGPYGFGRPAHGSQPGARYAFGDGRQSRRSG
jgi:hypothetical protein